MPNQYPRIIAASGDRYLAAVADGEGRVIDMGERIVHPRQPVAELLAHGDWEPAGGHAEILAEAKASFRWLKAPA